MNDTENQTPEQVAQMRDENWKFEATAVATAEPSADSQRAERIPARSLVGHEILIVSTTFVEGKLAACFRTTNAGDLFWFYTGTVVREQLDNTRLPTWGVLRMYKGTKHPFFYKLAFAETIKVERIDNKLSGSEPLQPQSGGTPSCKLKPHP